MEHLLSTVKANKVVCIVLPIVLIFIIIGVFTAKKMCDYQDYDSCC